MPGFREPCIPVRLKIRLWAFLLWLFFTLPNLIVTLTFYFTKNEDEENKNNATNIIEVTTEPNLLDEDSEIFPCYDNYTVYLPIYESTRFWVEGVGLTCVGVLGLCGNALTLAVLANSKGTKFNRLLVYLSVTDCVLIGFFLLLSYFTVLSNSEPQWYVFLFPYVIWPLGNTAITASVLMVIAVSYERYLAICSPLQYKPSPSFYVMVVACLSVSVNFGRFFEFDLVEDQGEDGSNVTSGMDYAQSALMQRESYVVFSRYWNEIFITGVLPVLALTFFNLGIWRKIRSSRKFRKLHDKTAFSSTTVRRNSDNNIAQALRKTSSDSPCRLGLPNAVSRHASVASLHTVGIQNNHNNTNNNSSSGERSSTPLLMGIVVVFCLCHFFRLFLQLDAIFNPSIMGNAHYEYCRSRGLFASPFSVWILTSCNQLSLVVNSSINFVVYCFVGRSFRRTLFDLCRRKKSSTCGGRRGNKSQKDGYNHDRLTVRANMNAMATQDTAILQNVMTPTAESNHVVAITNNHNNNNNTTTPNTSVVLRTDNDVSTLVCNDQGKGTSLFRRYQRSSLQRHQQQQQQQQQQHRSNISHAPHGAVGNASRV